MPKAAIEYGCLKCLKTEILNSIENIKHEIISFLQEFIQAASPNPPGDTTTASKVISKLLENTKWHFVGLHRKKQCQIL